MKFDASIFRLWSFLLLFPLRKLPKRFSESLQFRHRGAFRKNKKANHIFSRYHLCQSWPRFFFPLPFHPWQTHQQLFAGCASCGGEEALISTDEKWKGWRENPIDPPQKCKKQQKKSQSCLMSSDGADGNPEATLKGSTFKSKNYSFFKKSQFRRIAGFGAKIFLFACFSCKNTPFYIINFWFCLIRLR